MYNSQKNEHEHDQKEHEQKMRLSRYHMKTYSENDSISSRIKERLPTDIDAKIAWNKMSYARVAQHEI